MSERYTQADRSKAVAIFALEQAIQSGRYDADYISVIKSCITSIRNAGTNEVHILLNTPPTSNILNNFVGKELYGTWAITNVNEEKQECKCSNSAPTEKESTINKMKSYVPLVIKTAILSLFALCSLVGICESIHAISYYFNSSYYNRHVEDLYIGIGVLILSVAILLLGIFKLPRAYKEIPVLYRQSAQYRERCYKRIDKIYRYCERGSITKEEFESLKKEILSKIE